MEDTDPLKYDYNYRFTKQEYQDCLQAYRNNPNIWRKPDMKNHQDPYYFIKYPHTMPPLEAYKTKPSKLDLVNTPKNKEVRLIFYRWNNLTEFEVEKLKEFKEMFEKSKKFKIPEWFDDRDVLKFYQANHWHIDKSIDKVFKHLNWLSIMPPVGTMTKRAIRFLHSGAFYICGRDKDFRPCFVMDAVRMSGLYKIDPNEDWAAVLQECFIFLWQYIKAVMFLPGQIEQWVSILDLGNIAMSELPKDQMMAFGEVCSNNCMYVLHKAYYLNLSFTQNLLYNLVSPMIDPVTKKKMHVQRPLLCPELLEEFHPCQLEKRFGGWLDQPTNYWPPHVGDTFTPLSKQQIKYRNEIHEDQYQQILNENPMIDPHPDYLQPNQKSRDFQVQQPPPVVEPVIEPVKSIQSDQSPYNITEPVEQVLQETKIMYYKGPNLAGLVRPVQNAHYLHCEDEPQDEDLEVLPVPPKKEEEIKTPVKLNQSSVSQQTGVIEQRQASPEKKNTIQKSNQSQVKKNKEACCAVF